MIEGGACTVNFYPRCAPKFCKKHFKNPICAFVLRLPGVQSMSYGMYFGDFLTDVVGYRVKVRSSLPGNDKQGADLDVFITLKVLCTQEGS